MKSLVCSGTAVRWNHSVVAYMQRIPEKEYSGKMILAFSFTSPPTDQLRY